MLTKYGILDLAKQRLDALRMEMLLEDYRDDPRAIQQLLETKAHVERDIAVGESQLRETYHLYRVRHADVVQAITILVGMTLEELEAAAIV